MERDPKSGSRVPVGRVFRTPHYRFQLPNACHFHRCRGECPRILDCAKNHAMDLKKEYLLLSCSTGDPGGFIGFDDSATCYEDRFERGAAGFQAPSWEIRLGLFLWLTLINDMSLGLQDPPSHK